MSIRCRETVSAGEADVLKRTRQKIRVTRRLSTLLTALFALPLCLIVVFTNSVGLTGLAERAALFSAMVSMPEGSIKLLERHFAGRLDESYYQGKPGEVAPYVEPWEEEPEASSAPPPASSQEAAPSQPQQQPSAGRAKSEDPSPPKDNSHKVPSKYKGDIVQENMAATSAPVLRYGDAKLRNYTEVPDDEVVEIMNEGMNIHLEDTDEPQVLIFHTHATESYEPYDSENYDTRNTWRSTDNTMNMVAVGNALEKALTDAGIGVVHDTTQHDYPSYNGSYERSAETIKSYLKKYPSIKIALDVHRDAIQREADLIVKPTIEINGKKAAQLMMITGSDDGTMNVPEWRENLRFASSVQDAIERDYPQLTRPIFFCYRKYNMDLTTGSVLFEIGSNANTLEESVYTAELIGKSMAKLLLETKEGAQPASGPASEPVSDSGPEPAVIDGQEPVREPSSSAASVTQ